MTELIFAERGVSGIERLQIGPAGDVGRQIEVELPTLEFDVELGEEFTLKLLSGQSVEFAVEALRAKKTATSRAMILHGYDTIWRLSRFAPTREHIFVTLTRQEYEQYIQKTRNLRPKYQMHIRIGDTFGRQGWDCVGVAQELAGLCGLSAVVAGVVPHWIRQVVCREDSSILETLLALFRIQEPLIWVADNTLFIMDQSLLRRFAKSAPWVSSPAAASRTIDAPAIPSGSFLRLRGGLGKFRPDKFSGRTWTSPIRLSAALCRTNIEVRSPLLRSMLPRCKCFGGYEFERRVERGEKEVHIIKELWLKDVIGKRQLLLFSQDSVFKTPICHNWLSGGQCCGLGLRCNGMGTAVACRWYRASESPTRQDLLRQEETLHIYEQQSWDVETPREIESHTVISGRAWIRKKDQDTSATGEATVVSVWLDPLEYQIRALEYDEELGTLRCQVTQKRAVVFSDSCDCEWWQSLGEGEGGCILGRELCQHWDAAAGRCQIGLSCNRLGRLATCPGYTGTGRQCQAHETEDGRYCHYRASCPDCSLRWFKIDKLRGPSELPADSIVKTGLVAKGGFLPDKNGGRYSPDGADPECIVHQEIVRYEQVDEMTYRRTSRLVRLTDGIWRARTEAYNVPASSVPSHPIRLRRLRVFAEVGQSGEGSSAEPSVELSDSNLVDWDDAESVALAVYQKLSGAGIEDVYELPGEMLVAPGAPLLAPPPGQGASLPGAPQGAGIVTKSGIHSKTDAEGRGKVISFVQVRF